MSLTADIFSKQTVLPDLPNYFHLLADRSTFSFGLQAAKKHYIWQQEASTLGLHPACQHWDLHKSVCMWKSDLETWSSYQLHTWHVGCLGPEEVQCQLWCDIFNVNKHWTNRWPGVCSCKWAETHQSKWVCWWRQQLGSVYWVKLYQTLYKPVNFVLHSSVDWVQQQVFTCRGSITSGSI